MSMCGTFSVSIVVFSLWRVVFGVWHGVYAASCFVLNLFSVDPSVCMGYLRSQSGEGLFAGRMWT